MKIEGHLARFGAVTVYDCYAVSTGESFEDENIQ